MKNEVKNPPGKENYFLMCKRLFNVTGIYLYESNSINAKICTIFSIVTFILCAILFKNILVENYDLEEIMYTSGLIISYTKCLAIILKRKQLIKIFETLESGIFLPDFHRGGVEEKKLIREWISYLNKLGLISLPSVGIIVIWSYTFWTFNKYSKLPFGVFIEIINVEITAVIQSITFFLMGTGYLMTEVGVCMVLSHIKLHLKNLQICIKNLMQNSVKDRLKDTQKHIQIEEHDVEWKYLKNRLKEVVSYHSAILDVSKLVDEAFNLCHLVKFVCLSYLLCLLIYGMSKTRISDGFFWLQCSYVIILIVMLNLINYYINEVNIDSQNIANCCYNTEFVGTHLKFQKGLLLIMQRSQIPITLTVGKFAPLTIATSTAMMRATYSYFMVLRKHQ